MNQGAFPSYIQAQAPELQGIERRKRLADALQSQAMQPVEGGQAGGFVAPISWTQGLAKAMQAYVGRRQGEVADQEQKDLVTRYNSDLGNTLAAYTAATAGTPARQDVDAADNVTDVPAQGPDQEKAIAALMRNPATQQMGMQLAQQDAQRKALIASLRQAGGGAQAPQGNPMAPGGGSVMSPGGGAQAGPGGPASGIPLETWMQVDPSGKSYLQHLSKGGESSGRVFYDQEGRAFTVTGSGEAKYLPGITHRDEMKMADTGPTLQPYNPFKQNQPISKGFTPMQAAELPLQQQRQAFETGLPTPGTQQPRPLGNAPAAPPGPRPAAAPQPAAAQPGAGMTPKAQAALNAKRAEEMPQARQSVELQSQGLDRITEIADELKDHPGLFGSTGMQGAIPSIPGQSSAQAEALMDSLKAQISGAQLQAMRNASKTGGAVGNVTEKEWPRLENMITALNPVKMGRDTFQRKLGELQSEIGRMRKSMHDAYKNEYGEGLEKGGLSPSEKIELEALRKAYPRGGR